MNERTLESSHWLERIRATVRYRIGVEGYRRNQLAREMGTNPEALRTLLLGGVPAAVELARIEAYCTAGVVEDAYAAQAALAALVESLPLAMRLQHRTRAVEMLSADHSASKAPEPEWMNYERAGRIVIAPSHTTSLELRRAAARVLRDGPRIARLPADP